MRSGLAVLTILAWLAAGSLAGADGTVARWPSAPVPAGTLNLVVEPTAGSDYRGRHGTRGGHRDWDGDRDGTWKKRKRRRVRRVVIAYRDSYRVRRESPPVDWEPPALPPQERERAEREPLDPGGASRLIRARRVAPAAETGRVRVGREIPGDIPHVTLSPAHYDLPRPPEGEIYARVRGKVFRIDAATRLVTARVDP